jgi:hypothetical protein
MPTAKTFLISCALSTCAVACSASSTPDSAASSEAADVVACEAAPAPRDVVIDLDHDVSDLRCQAIMGWFITFRWENAFYMAWVSDSGGVCPTELDALRRASESASGLHGVVTERAGTDGTTHWVANELTLDVEGGFTFRATKCSDPPAGG